MLGRIVSLLYLLLTGLYLVPVHAIDDITTDTSTPPTTAKNSISPNNNRIRSILNRSNLDNDTFSAIQSGNTAAIFQFGSNNNSEIEQQGSSNHAYNEQIGSGNNSQIIQIGNNNITEQYQLGRYNNVISIQHGNNNLSRQIQYGSGINSRITQNGNNIRMLIRQGY